MGKGGLACAAPFPKSCAQIWAQDSGCSLYKRSNQQNFKNEKFIVDYHMPPRHAARLLIWLAAWLALLSPISIYRSFFPCIFLAICWDGSILPAETMGMDSLHFFNYIDIFATSALVIIAVSLTIASIRALIK